MTKNMTALLVLLSLSACRPSLDGAWDGTADCTATGAHPVSALFDEQSDGDLKGHLFIENINIVIGFVTVRAEIDDGEYDADDNEYAFDLNSDDDGAPEFSVTLEIDDQDADDANGDIDQFDDAGTVSQTCELDLSRLSEAGN